MLLASLLGARFFRFDYLTVLVWPICMVRLLPLQAVRAVRKVPIPVWWTSYSARQVG